MDGTKERSRKVGQIVDGLMVLETACPGRVSVDAQHDVIYAGCFGEPAGTPETVSAGMKAAGWHWDDTAESWALFT